MRRAFSALLPRAALLAALAAGAALAAEKEGQDESGLVVWRTVNFVLLAAGLGYLAVKYVGPYFAARSVNIRRAMVEAEEVRREAEQKAAAVEARLVNLAADIAALRQESEREMKAESERLAQGTAAALANIDTSLKREISAATKAGALELRRHSARLALALAERQVRARLNQQTEDLLVEGFVSDLDRPAAARSD